MEGNINISVLIPAFNEEEKIGETVKTSKNIPGVTQVLVVDDGSTDRTALVALEHGAEVVSLGKNTGKGGAVNAGAANLKGSIVLLLDGDLGKSAAGSEKLLKPLINGTADMAIAIFPKTGIKGGFGFVKGLARAGIKLKTGLRFEAPLSGQRAVRREVLCQCLPIAYGYGMEVDLTIKAAKKGFRIVEVPVNMVHRFTGRDIEGFIHRGKQFWHVIKVFTQ